MYPNQTSITKKIMRFYFFLKNFNLFFKMPKRKIVEEPPMWKVKNAFLFLLSKNKYATVEYQKLKSTYPNIRVCFIKNAVNRMQAIFAELSDPTPFPEIDNNYHVVEARTLGKETKIIKLGKYNLCWNGKHLKCLRTRICKKCFVKGKLSPRTCHEHLKCTHRRKKVRNCKSCVSSTLLGYWKERIACFQGDKEILFTVSRGSTTNNSFKCSECQHLFPISSNNMTTYDQWCSYCANKKLCDSETCETCYNKSFASHEKSKDWIKEKNNKIPRQIFKSTRVKFWFHCKICLHDSHASPHDNTKCKYCAHKNLCDDNTCEFCYNNSFASHEKAEDWNYKKNNNIIPRNVFKMSNDIFWFHCRVCSHDFDSGLNNINRGDWCPFCSHHKLCDSETCQKCYDNSFASHPKSIRWNKEKNYPVVPRNVFRSSNLTRWFDCDICFHCFDLTPGCISCSNTWCPFCAHQRLCDNTRCDFCFKNSFANHKKSEDWHPTKNYPFIPRNFFMRAQKICWFSCRKCNHDFDMLLLNASSNGWCPFCAGQRRCDKPICPTCAQSCDVCKMKKAQTRTQITKTWVCFTCLADALVRDPNERPILQRAKISLEIFTLGELIRHSEPGLFINTPTAWDCPILPGLNFKPDLIWCFDETGSVIQLGNVNKLNLNMIRYALSLEILEGSRASHSKQRSISDEDREVNIRNLFDSQKIPFGLLNVTIAHNRHFHTNPNDVFFIKPGQDQEYQVLPHKLEAWISRVIDIRDTLVTMFEDKTNETICIGN
jgi:hypothetical protein